MLVEASHAAMATEWTIALHVASQPEARPLLEAAFEEIDRVEALLSRFRPTSEIARIVREAPYGAVTIDPEVFRLLAFARAWSERTGGAFDITVAPLLRAFGFPSPDARFIARNEPHVGWTALRLDPSARTVEFAEERALELDLGAIGKGHAVDCVATLLREHGVTAALISAGSSTLYGLNRPPGEEGWQVWVSLPGGLEQEVLLCDRAISTSSAQEHFVERDGERTGHLFDPRSGKPVRETRQTHAIAATALESEVLSTATYVLGLEAGSSLLHELRDVEGLLLTEKERRAVRWPVRGLLTAIS